MPLIALSPVSIKAAKQGVVICASGCRLIHDNDVQARQFGSMVAERLPDYALQSVSACCQATVLLADRQAKARHICAIGPVENGKHVIATSFGLFKDATV